MTKVYLNDLLNQSLIQVLTSNESITFLTPTTSFKLFNGLEVPQVLEIVGKVEDLIGSTITLVNQENNDFTVGTEAGSVTFKWEGSADLYEK